jgi:hypothetical protein
VPVLSKYYGILLQYLQYVRLIYHGKLLPCRGKLPWYLGLPPWTNVIKLFTMVIYCHSIAVTAVILFYSAELQKYLGTAVK